MFYWDWLNDCLDWGDYWGKTWSRNSNISSATTKTSITTTYDGNELVVKDNTTGDSLKIAKENLGSKEADEAYKMFMERCKHEEKPKIEAPKFPDFNVGDFVEIVDNREAYNKHHDFIKKYPDIAIYYQFGTTPANGLVGTVKMMCFNSYEEDSNNRYICVVQDDEDRVWLVGDNGLEKITNA